MLGDASASVRGRGRTWWRLAIVAQAVPFFCAAIALCHRPEPRAMAPVATLSLPGEVYVLRSGIDRAGWHTAALTSTQQVHVLGLRGHEVTRTSFTVQAWPNEPGGAELSFTGGAHDARLTLEVSATPIACSEPLRWLLPPLGRGFGPPQATRQPLVASPGDLTVAGTEGGAWRLLAAHQPQPTTIVQDPAGLQVQSLPGTAVSVADFDGDGCQDAVTQEATANALIGRLFRRTGRQLHLAWEQRWPLTWEQAEAAQSRVYLAAANLDDGDLPQLVVAQPGTGNLTVLRWRARG